jgi:exodeoxyribonuclease VII small subunit
MTPKKVQKRTFEDALRRLEAIVESLEQGKVSLDEAVGLYEEGIQLSKECAEKLKATELKIKKLTKSVSGQLEIRETDEE